MLKKPACFGLARGSDWTGDLANTSIYSNKGAGRRPWSQHAVRLELEPFVGRRGIFGGGFGGRLCSNPPLFARHAALEVPFEIGSPSPQA
jgi:hypothetical protein